MINKKIAKVGVLTLSVLLLSACAKNANNNSDDEYTTPTATESVTSTQAPTDVANTEEPTPEPTDEPEVTPTPDEWTYNIVQSGYYNAMATWDDKGKLKEAAKPVAGNDLYYNDFDEYYDNFVHPGNVIGSAELSLTDLYQHSGDNSVKITNRLSKAKGFSGFNLKFGGENGFKKLWSQSFTGTLDFWVYYRDDLNITAPKELTFAIWCNSLSDETIAKVHTLETLQKGVEDKKKLEAIERTFNEGTEKGYYCISRRKVKKNTWTRLQIPIKINGQKEVTKETLTSLAITTLNEVNNKNVSYYIPFYIDDVVIHVDEVK